MKHSRSFLLVIPGRGDPELHFSSLPFLFRFMSLAEETQ